MKSNFLINRDLSLPFLFLLLTAVACSSVSGDSGERIRISAEAARIAPQFKSAVFRDNNGTVLPYRFFEPSGQGGDEATYPLVLYLHGEEGFGTDNEAQLLSTEGATIWIEPEHLAKNLTYVLAPQAPPGSDWTSDPVYTSLLALLDQFIEGRSDIDRDRIYIVGFSAGATGVWNMILNNPSLFAAALPISGNADKFLGDNEAFAALKNLPVLVVHSIDDPVSPVSGSENAIAALRAAGNRSVGFNTSIWGMGGVPSPHDAWLPAFHNYGVIYNWIFEQSLSRTNHGSIDPTTLYTTHDLGNGVKAVWDYALGTSYILERPGKAIIIDVAAGNGSIYQFIRDSVLVNKDVDLEILVTHNHFDHIGGLSSFVGSSQLKRVHVHQADSEPVRRLMGSDAGKVEFIKDGDKIPLGESAVDVIGVTGHTWGSLVYLYENNLYTGDAIGSGDLWMSSSVMSVEDFIPSVQHLLEKIEGRELSVWGGHSGEYRTPMTDEYVRQILASAQGLVDGSIIGVPYRRTIGGRPTLGYAATVGRASIVHNLNNIRTIPGALRSLNISSGSLTPQFAPYTAYYSATVDSGVETVRIIPTVLADQYEHMTVNGNRVDSGAAYEARLNTGENRFSIAVTASDQTVKKYTLTISRQ
jgi:glyoxylase-like metal-dependent hydrolase (beta-lactamase superfamily II)/poly(3-hydroxybutyrate) depolymerase